MQGVGNHRTDSYGISCRVDVLDDQEPVVVVGVGRIGGCTSENPLSLGDEQCVAIGQAASLAPFVDRQFVWLFIVVSGQRVGRRGLMAETRRVGACGALLG